MVALTALLIPIGLLASANIEKPKSFTVWMLLLEAAVIGVFLALDAIVFFVFFEFVLVPMYFLIAGWGHGNRRYAAMKFFLFTMAGSAFLFVGDPVASRSCTSTTPATLTFDIAHAHRLRVGEHQRRARPRRLFLAFAIGFAVKVPLFPFHTWLPDAHTDAPTAGSVVLAGVMLKIGTYGFLRLAVPFFPQAAVDLAPLLLVLAVIGITYGAIVAAMQPNLKRIVAYSSVAHLGFVVLGMFAFTQPGHHGRSVHDAVARPHDRRAVPARRHALRPPAHLRAQRLPRPVEGRAGVRRPVRRGDVRVDRPARLLRASSASSSSLLGAFLTRRWYVVVATTGVILAAVYLLWAVQRAFTGEPDDENARHARHRLPRARARSCRCSGCRCSSASTRSRCSTGSQPSVDALVAHVEQHSDFKVPPVSDAGRAASTPRGRSEHASTQQDDRGSPSERERSPCSPTIARRSTGSRSRRRSRCSRPRIVIVLRSLADPARPAVHAASLSSRSSGIAASGRVRRDPVGVRARRRSVPGDERHGRGRRLRRVRAAVILGRDVARVAVLGRLPEAARISKAPSTSC